MTGWRKRTIMEMALEALETAEIDGNCEYEATEIIRKALAQPEQRTWVGLTDEEVDDAARYCVKSGQSVNAAIRAIEAKLKEKNFDKK
jgi:bacterioferritin-associated ferredoxin